MNRPAAPPRPTECFVLFLLSENPIKRPRSTDQKGYHEAAIALDFREDHVGLSIMGWRLGYWRYRKWRWADLMPRIFPRLVSQLVHLHAKVGMHSMQ